MILLLLSEEVYGIHDVHISYLPEFHRVNRMLPKLRTTAYSSMPFVASFISKTTTLGEFVRFANAPDCLVLLESY